MDRYDPVKGGRLAAIILLLLLCLLTFPGDGVSGQEGTMMIEFQLDFDSTGSGDLHFFVGTEKTDRLELAEIEEPGDIGSYDNRNLIRVMDGLSGCFDDRERLFRELLDTTSDVVLKDVIYKKSNETNVFAFSLDLSFCFNDTGSIEYRYLKFIKSIPIPYAEKKDRYAEMWKDREIEMMRQCIISIRFDLSSDLSMDLQNEGSDHHRTPSGESLERKTDLYEFINENNGLIISDNVFFSPMSLFIITIIITLSGYIGLAVIWWKNMFKGVGLILPISTLLISFLPITIYYNPQMNGYSLMDLFLFLAFILYLGMVTGCYFVNPRFERIEKSYEEEKRPIFEMPKVTYVEKNVYIRQLGHEGIDPYDVIGVTRSMSTDEITKKYKEEILRFHPDRFADMSDKVRKMSERETERLNQAYEAIMKERAP